jgi:hypothetical protein
MSAIDASIRSSMRERQALEREIARELPRRNETSHRGARRARRHRLRLTITKLRMERARLESLSRAQRIVAAAEEWAKEVRDPTSTIIRIAAKETDLLAAVRS